MHDFNGRKDRHDLHGGSYTLTSDNRKLDNRVKNNIRAIVCNCC